ncbi:MAG: 16S rRNA (cytidine(1402)-2'-O)-methyltransferase [Acidimicrobiales bacterium]
MVEDRAPGPRAGALVLVATPLGNLGDLTRRAREALETADAVYCEDTRRTRVLFSAYGMAPRGRLRALHEHNEASRVDEVVARVAAGEVVALVSDAGTPGISDPGSRVVAAVVAAGLDVTTTPGPSAVVAALSISGLPTDRFVMEGFLPRTRGARDKLYRAWDTEARTIVFFESPQRVVTTLREIAARSPQRRVAVARELTKVHEEVVRGPVGAVADQLASRETLGEFVVVLDGSPAPAPNPEDLVDALRARLDEGLSVRDAVGAVADELGVAHRDAYRVALTLRSEERGR